ncbi:MAG: M61 family peptidase, partial [Thiomonas sp.]
MTSSASPRSRTAALVQAPPGSSQTGPSYRVSVADALAHQFLVELDLPHPEPAGQEFWLPVWIPGSYLVREFARHVLQVQAWCADKPIALHKIAKNRWRAAPCNGP